MEQDTQKECFCWSEAQADFLIFVKFFMCRWSAKTSSLFDLTKSAQLMVVEPQDLNHYTPLSAYMVRGPHLISPTVLYIRVIKTDRDTHLYAQ